MGRFIYTDEEQKIIPDQVIKYHDLKNTQVGNSRLYVLSPNNQFRGRLWHNCSNRTSGFYKGLILVENGICVGDSYSPGCGANFNKKHKGVLKLAELMIGMV